MASASPPRYRLAGSLAMVNALLTIPWVIMTFFLQDRDLLVMKILNALLMTASTGIFVYTSLTLRKLLNTGHSFTDADRYLLLMIKAGVVLTFISLLETALPAFASAAGTLALFLIVPLGIVQILFGLKLQNLPSELGGLRRPYCYLNIFTGFCFASILLMPVGIITGAITDIMLGTIFFQESKTGRLINTEA